ncbi:uncharacterized protein LOC129768096 isoform X2 [Toxorhynchites rutilus septentrionalis]|nr:uncharacterized protein LOC129768096 isoform X2 [Toxorhynchites rutilus septentrionalis]XP_055625510.1 uncharacterized protein LOC129768096 isoform X2 [Toxorhynchites rutilus septentrionalis]XP_055625519.1 uncharacterized protein LOC129768096 isoform X2 [Toxorhynchites rutilus septentrionalis]XP_055625528.1 uncharacterized protein LOC129768096 isoform X2 [Toxorhynchites rutilus septentrionalis]
MLPLIDTPWKIALVVFLLVATCTQANVDRTVSEASQKPHVRHTRALGFFQKIATMGRLIYQQYNDTTWTLKNVYDVLSNEFTDTFTTTTPNPLTSTTTPGPTSSTTAKYRISRAELGRILNRNYRGLQKLFRLEWNDAWNQTRYNVDFYKRELQNSAFPPRNATNVTTTARP